MDDLAYFADDIGLYLLAALIGIAMAVCAWRAVRSPRQAPPQSSPATSTARRSREVRLEPPRA